MTAPRSVAMVVNTLGSGGVPEAVLNLCAHLPRAQYEPHLFVLKAGGNPSESQAFSACFRDADVPVTIAQSPDGKIGAVAELADWLMQRRMNILQSHSFRPNLYARMAGAICRQSGLRIVAQYHNQYDDKWPVGSSALLLERQLAQVTDAMVAVSTSVRDHVVQKLGLREDRITVIPNGVTPGKVRPIDRQAARRQLGLAPQDLAIGLIGRVCAQKGQEDLVEAALKLRQRLPQAVFLLIGAVEDAALHARIEALIGGEKATDRIRFIGHMSDIAPAYTALDLLVAPSRWEGFGLVLVEAMAAGLPILATDVGAIAEVTGGAARLVAAGNPSALADAILSFDPKARERAAATGKERCLAFSWKASAARLAALYDQLPPP
jgi:glycosyltransferase involved in cell wall biosynthesis